MYRDQVCVRARVHDKTSIVGIKFVVGGQTLAARRHDAKRRGIKDVKLKFARERKKKNNRGKIVLQNDVRIYRRVYK